MYYHIFFQNFINKSILASRIEEIRFLDFRNGKKGLSSKNKKIKEQRLYYCLNKFRYEKIIIRGKLP